MDGNVAENQVRLGMPVQEADLLLQIIGRPDVVGIQDGDEAPLGDRYSRVVSRTGSLILPVPDVANLWASDSFHNFPRVVRGGIVNHQNFRIGVGLLQRAPPHRE